jgi:hypothetical protein
MFSFVTDAASVTFLVGIAAVVAEVTLSGFISVYFERVLKGTPAQRSLTVWDRNVQACDSRETELFN